MAASRTKTVFTLITFLLQLIRIFTIPTHKNVSTRSHTTALSHGYIISTPIAENLAHVSDAFDELYHDTEVVNQSNSKPKRCTSLKSCDADAQDTIESRPQRTNKNPNDTDSNATYNLFYQDVEKKDFKKLPDSKAPFLTIGMENLTPTKHSLVLIDNDTFSHKGNFTNRATTESYIQYTGVSLEQSLQFSCRGKCGLEISFPCGCSVACVVYGTCCENMDQDCPQITKEGLTNFRHLLDSEIICDDDSIYKIASCPRLEDCYGDQDVDLCKKGAQDLDLASTQYSQEMNIPEDNIVRRITNILLSGPVTEEESGFTFINKSIYDCNMHNISSFSSWSLYLRYIYKAPDSVEELEPYIGENYTFVPKFNQKILLPHLCRNNIIRNCRNISGQHDQNESYQNKCENSPHTTIFSGNRLYANRYCAYCSESKHDGLILFENNEFPIRAIGLKILMSLSDTGDFNLNLNDDVLLPTAVSWVSAKCSFLDVPRGNLGTSQVSSGQSSQTICRVKCVENEFVLSADDKCKSRHFLLVALSDDGLSPLCQVTVERLANFIACGLEALSSSLAQADLIVSTKVIHFDNTLNKNLYTITLYADLYTRIGTLHPTKRVKIFMENFQVLALLAEFYKMYRLSHNLCPGGELEEEGIRFSTYTLSSKTLEDALRLYYPPNSSWLLKAATHKGRKNDTTVCTTGLIESSKASKGYDDELYEYMFVCTNVSIFQLDPGVRKSTEGSKCFDLLLETSSRSNGFGWMFTCKALAVSVVITAFIGNDHRIL